MKRIILAVLLTSTTSAAANDRASDQEALNTSFWILGYNYAMIRIGSDYCGLPESEWLSARTRILTASLDYPGIDILKVERDLDRRYEQEKSRWGPNCDENLLKMHKLSVEGIDRDLPDFRELISKVR